MYTKILFAKFVLRWILGHIYPLKKLKYVGVDKFAVKKKSMTSTETRKPYFTYLNSTINS
jgi:hypothetical protein